MDRTTLKGAVEAIIFACGTSVEAERMAQALSMREGDIIAVIGKGHEDYQEINGVKHHFLDREEVERAVAELGL